jgi:hypothetical protein
MRGMTRSLVQRKMIEDHIKIGSVLQELFVLNTYRQEIESVNEEHAAAVLNITHKVSPRISRPRYLASDRLHRFWTTVCLPTT